MTGAPEYMKTFNTGYGLELCVTVGDIINVDADAIVTSEEEGLLHTSLITQLLINTIPEFAAKREELKTKSNAKAWTVRKTALTGSKFQFVFHAFIKKDTDNWVNNMIKLYDRILRKAEKRRIHVLALPLIGSGRAKKSLEDCAQALITGIADFRPSSLQKIWLVSEKWPKADKISTQCVYQFSPNRTASTRRSIRHIFSRKRPTSVCTDKILKQTDTAATSQTVPTDGDKQIPSRPFAKSALLSQSLPVITDQSLVNSTTLARPVWSPEAIGATNENVHRTTVTDGKEYNAVAESFFRGFRSKPNIKEIARIEISTLKTQYDIKKDQICGTMPCSAMKERILWHGTSEDSSNFICINGFNRGHCGRDGAAGCGVYFTTSPSASPADTSTNTSTDDLKYVFRALVLTGTPVVGSPGIRVPPKRDAEVLYDSTVDDVDNPSVFVIYQDTQAYPQYLITYQ